MNSSLIAQKIQFRLRTSFSITPTLRKVWWGTQGARFGKGTRVPRLAMTWPHQVYVGCNCTLEDDIYFKFDGVWQTGPSIVIGDGVFVGRGCEFNIRKGMTLGNDCLVASGCKFIDHDHGTDRGQLMNAQAGPEASIVLEDNVWLGFNVIVLKGVHIAAGAVVGAGAVVTKSISENEIWGGVPARKIGERTAFIAPININ